MNNSAMSCLAMTISKSNPDASIQMHAEQMSLPMHIYRSKTIPAIFLLACSALIVLWLLTILGIIEMDGISELFFSVFILGGVVPCFIYFFWLAIHRKPVLSIYGDRIVLCNIADPRHAVAVRRDDIVQIKTNWEGLNNESWSDLIFHVTGEAYESLVNSKVWRKKDDYLYFEFTGTVLDPFQAVEILSEYIQETDRHTITHTTDSLKIPRKIKQNG